MRQIEAAEERVYPYFFQRNPDRHIDLGSSANLLHPETLRSFGNILFEHQGK